jgi:hypothetical protein
LDHENETNSSDNRPGFCVLRGDRGFQHSRFFDHLTVFHRPEDMHVYEVRPRKDKRGFDLLSDALPFGGLCYRFTGSR